MIRDLHSANKWEIKLSAARITKVYGASIIRKKCNDLVILEKTTFPFRYNSNCRGKEIFSPLIRGEAVSQPQIPVTLPTYDEVIGSNHVSERNYNDYLISLLKPEKLNVLTIHAEVEGVVCLEMFDRFLKMVHAIGAKIVPLGELLMDSPEIKHATMVAREIPGREGWVSCQEAAASIVQS